MIIQYDFDDVYSLELEYNKKAKEVSISKDKFGNIIIYLNENKDDIGYYPARYRKGGKKYYIPVNSEHLSAHEYVEALIQLIDRKNNSPKMIEYFELLLRDPRLERKISEYLEGMPKANDNICYQEQKRKIEQEYQKKLATLNSEYEESNSISQLSNQYNGLVPETVIRKKTRHK